MLCCRRPSPSLGHGKAFESLSPVREPPWYWLMLYSCSRCALIFSPLMASAKLLELLGTELS